MHQSKLPGGILLLSTLKHLIRIALFGVITLALLCTQVGGASALGPRLQVNAQVVNYAIVFVSRKIQNNGSLYMAPSETGSMPGVGPYSRLQVSAPGKLVVREANGTLRNLVDGSKPTAASLNLIDVNAPDVSYDGTKIVFAGLVKGSYETGHLTNPGAWRIYVINVDGTGLRQVTISDRENLDLSQFQDVGELFKKYDDTDPAWLPDGRIVFSSTRWPSFGQYGGSRTTNLYVVNSNGTGMHRITSERSGADRPQVDPLTGKIVYSRWWRNFRVAIDSMKTIADPQGGYIMKDGLLSIVHSQPPPNMNEVGGFKNLERNSWQLAAINPDGTGLTQWGGRSSTYFYGQMANHAYGGGFGKDGTFYANFFPMNNMTEAAGFGGIRSYVRGPKGYKAIIGVNQRDDSKIPLVKYNPPSHGVYVSNYAAEAEALPDGRLVISWAKDIKQDYGLYTINSNGSGLTKLYDNPGTTELRARVIQPRPLPPIIADVITQVASPLPPLAQGPYDVDGTFTFQALNVYFNAPVDTDILSAMPVGSANTMRFFIDHQRWQQNGSHESLDWPILLKELPLNPNGSITTTSPANVPLFEQVRTTQPVYRVPLTGRTVSVQELGGASHVAGMNFGRPGEVVRCVGCHAGHSMIPVPANDEDAQWTNLAPGAAIRVSSLDTSLPNGNGLIDRRVKMPFPPNTLQKYWLSKPGLDPGTQWIQLTFPVPVTVRTVRLYNIPAVDSPLKVLETTVRLYGDSAGTQLAASAPSGALSENGTDVTFDDVLAKVVRIEFDSVNGTVAGLGEVEVIARGEGIVDTSVSPVNVTLGEDLLGSHNVPIKDVVVESYAGVQNGPVKVTSPDNIKFFASQRVISGDSFNEVMGFSNDQLTTEYWFPWYDNVSMDTWILVGNASSSQTANVSVYVGATKRSYTIPPGGLITPRYPGTADGPVRVISTNGVNIFTSERAVYNGAFNEVMGYPANQLTTEYWFPRYDNVSMAAWILVGNPSSTQTANVSIYVGTTKRSYTIPPRGSITPRYPGTNEGLVRVVSTNGVKIFTSERSLYGDSFNEVMGYPGNQLTTKYSFPWYDNVSMSTWILVGNPSSTQTANVDVYVGTTKRSYTIPPRGSITPRYPATNEGPVRIVSTNNVKIFASQRVIYLSSFNEVMGYPNSKLAIEYWFPWYDSVTMSTDILIGMP